MKRMKKLSFLLLALVFVFIISSAFYKKEAKSHKQISGEELAFEVGRNLKEAKTTTSENPVEEEIYAQGDDVVIPQKHITQCAKGYIALGKEEEEAEELAYHYLVRNACVLHDAIEAGYTITEEELSARLQEARDTAMDSVESDQIQALYEGAGGEEQYWTLIRGKMRETFIIGDYLEDKLDEYEASLTEEEKLTMEGGMYDALNEERERIIQESVASQHMKIIK